MKDLNRFEYLQLAASLMPENTKTQDYNVLSDELLELAKAIKAKYDERYRYDDPDSFDILNHFEKSMQSSD